MDDTAIRQLIQREMAQTEALMQAEMRAEVPLAELVMRYAIGDAASARPLLTC